MAFSDLRLIESNQLSDATAKRLVVVQNGVAKDGTLGGHINRRKLSQALGRK